MVWERGSQLSALSDTQTTMLFKYDCNGIRTLKRVNGVDTEFTYVGDMLVSQKTGTEVINFAYTASGAPYGFTYNGQSYYYLLNLQGDVIAIYDSSGNVVVEYLYDSWGKLEAITGTLADTVGVKNPLRYRGYYYDPETCRFISMDAYFVAGDYLQGTNMYSYCLNNPVMYVDPSGHSSDEIINSSTQLAIDITKAIVGTYLFDAVCKSFGIDGFAKLEGALGEIVDIEFEVYEFEVSDVFESATDYSTDISVSGAIELLMGKLFSKIKFSTITNLIISTTLSSAVYALLEEIDLKTGNYVLIHFSFLELRESWSIGDFFVHDFFFLYFQSNDKDYPGNLLDEAFSPYKFWYSFMDM